MSGLKYSMMSGRLWSVHLTFSCFPCLPLNLCLLNLERIPTLHNGYPWLALLWGGIIKSSMQIQIKRIGSGCRYYKACTTCNATEYLLLFWAVQNEFGTQKPDVVNASSSSLLLVPLLLQKEKVFYMLERNWISALHRCCAQVLMKGIGKTLDILSIQANCPNLFYFWNEIGSNLLLETESRGSGNKLNACDEILAMLAWCNWQRSPNSQGTDDMAETAVAMEIRGLCCSIPVAARTLYLILPCQLHIAINIFFACFLRSRHVEL